MIIHPKAPFDFALTVNYQTAFEAANGPDLHWDGSVYQRVVEIGEKAVLVSVRSSGSLENPELVVAVEDVEGQQGLSGDEEKKVTDLVGWLLGVDQDLEPFYEVAKQDEVMAGLARRFYGLHLPQTATVFECLALTVVGQYRMFQGASSRRSALINDYGREVDLGGRSWRVFPKPNDIFEAPIFDLMSCLEFDNKNKISLQKAKSLKRVAGHATELGRGVEDLRDESDQVALLRLELMRGVKSWTAQWVLIRGLGRPDALPLTGTNLVIGMLTRYYKEIEVELSFDIKKLIKEYGENFKKIAQRWEPYRSYGTTYLLEAGRRRIPGLNQRSK